MSKPKQKRIKAIDVVEGKLAAWAGFVLGIYARDEDTVMALLGKETSKERKQIAKEIIQFLKGRPQKKVKR